MTAMERAQLGEDITPHIMRHSVRTWFAQRSVACGFLAMTPETYNCVYVKRHDPPFMQNAVKALER
jgi:hypothetical protein